MTRAIGVTYATSVVPDVIQGRLIDHQNEGVVLTKDADSWVRCLDGLLVCEQQLLVHVNPRYLGERVGDDESAEDARLTS